MKRTAGAVSRQQVTITSRHGRDIQRCSATDPPDRRPKPGRSVAAQNRMRELGLRGGPKKGNSPGMSTTGKPANGAKPPASSGKPAKPGNPAERRRRFLLGNGEPEEPLLPSSSMPSQVSPLEDIRHSPPSAQHSPLQYLPLLFIIMNVFLLSGESIAAVSPMTTAIDVLVALITTKPDLLYWSTGAIGGTERERIQKALTPTATEPLLLVK